MHTGTGAMSEVNIKLLRGLSYLSESLLFKVSRLLAYNLHRLETVMPLQQLERILRFIVLAYGPRYGLKKLNDDDEKAEVKLVCFRC